MRNPASVLYFKHADRADGTRCFLQACCWRACVLFGWCCRYAGCRCCRGVSCPDVVSGASCCLCWGIQGRARIHLWGEVTGVVLYKGSKDWRRPQQTASWAACALSCGGGETCGGGCIVAHFGLAFTVLTVLCGSERSSYTFHTSFHFPYTGRLPPFRSQLCTCAGAVWPGFGSGLNVRCWGVAQYAGMFAASPVLLAGSGCRSLVHDPKARSGL